MIVQLGDGIREMERLKSGVARLVIADLPSGETQAAFDKPVSLSYFWAAVHHALKADGTTVILASSLRFAAQVVASNSAEFRYDLVWSKSAATGFLNARKRPLRAHEFVLVFGRRGASIYNPQMVEGASPIHAARRRANSQGENYNTTTRVTESRAGATDRFPTSVLEFGSVGTSSRARRHPQQKPIGLLQWIIRTYSEPRSLVVDPCAGSGSTLEAAELEKRRAIGWDIDPRFGISSASASRRAS